MHADLPFLKGHGTENDFVLLPDPDGALSLSPDLVRAVCDRRAGIGGDGVLRVVRSAADPEAASRGERSGSTGTAEWFMDYRNADGSRAEMCGNGIRVYARYLVDAGLAAPGRLRVATRDGVKTVEVPRTGDIAVDMGPVRIVGSDISVEVAGRRRSGVAVDTGNPHLVVTVDDPVEALDLTAPPVVPAAEFPDGVNVELVHRTGPRAARMRVHERGVGETRSCGTGVCAAAAALQGTAGHGAAAQPGSWLVAVPGGTLTVRLDQHRAVLSGPAVIVAEGVLRAGFRSRG